MQAQRPQPSDYYDYREYLRSMVRHLKQTQRTFSYRSFARRAGFASASFLKHVVEGERNLSPESIGKFADGLGLEGREREDFETLVLLAHARSESDRTRYHARLRRRRKGKVIPLDQAQYGVYSLWYAIPLRELLALPGLRDDPAWMAKRFWHSLSPAEVEQALKLLEEARLVRREDGKLPAPVAGVAETPATVHSSAIRNFHREMLRLAGEGLDALAVEDRSVTSLTVKMSRKKYAEVCEKIGQWQDEILSLLREDDLETNGGEVYSLVFSATPLTRTKKS